MTAPSKPVMPERLPTVISEAYIRFHHDKWNLYCASLEADRERMREALETLSGISEAVRVEHWTHWKWEENHSLDGAISEARAALAPLSKEPTNG